MALYSSYKKHRCGLSRASLSIDSHNIISSVIRIRFVVVVSVLIVLVQPSIIKASDATRAQHAMVVCAHPEASKVGVAILREGGNAIDAAVAVQFALAVVYPNAGNIGGGGFLVWRSHKGEALSLDFREKAPHRSHRDMFLDSTGNVLPSLSLVGPLAAGVPGSVDGMVEAHKRLGSKPWKILLQPAIDLARKGFAITKKQADDLNEFSSELKKHNEKCMLVRERPWRMGDTLVQLDLATTLELIRDNGRDGFYTGACAKAIVDEMKRGNGLIDQFDLDNYHAVWREVLRGNFRGCTIFSMPPPSSGGIALLQLLSLWQMMAVTAHDVPYPAFHSVQAVHLMAECERRVYADRSEWLGDPDFVTIPQHALLKTDYLLNRMNDFRLDSVTPSSDVKPGDAMKYESEETTHFSIVDSVGNAVALTTTLNASYGSKVMVLGAGFLLNNEMDDFSVKANTPNYYGLLGNERNAVAPAKRMLSCMTPTIVERDGALFMVLGTPGGSTIITSVFQCIVNVIDYHLTIQQSVDAGRFHHQWMPDQIIVEEQCLSESVREKLESYGHHISKRKAIGRVDAILIAKDGWREAGADGRGDDSAMGF